MRLYAKNIDSRERVFFIRPQALEASRKSGLTYDGWSSAAIIYAYVSGQPTMYTDPMGLEKVNLLGPHDSGQWAQSNLRDDPNMLIITAHGNPLVVVDYRDLSTPNRMDARKLEDFIRKNTKWKEGMSIHLDVCTAGGGANSIAKQLAIGMNTRVRAATDVVQTFFPFNMGTSGEWRWFSPNGSSIGNGSRFP